MTFVYFMRSIAGRLLRIIAGGITIIYPALTRRVDAPWSFVVAAVGVVPILAGIMNFCLLRPLFRVDLWGRPKTAPVR